MRSVALPDRMSVANDEWNIALALMLEVLKQLLDWWALEWRTTL